MSFVPIPNQPLAFNAGRNAGCVCAGPEERLLLRNDDTLRFQLGIEGLDSCAGDELLASPTFQDPTN